MLGISPDAPEYEAFIDLYVWINQYSVDVAMGISGTIEVKSLIGDVPALARAAEEMGRNQAAQAQVDALVKKLMEGNVNPGIGTSNLFKDIFYLRGKSGARVFYRIREGAVEILAKAHKGNEDKVIEILTKLFK